MRAKPVLPQAIPYTGQCAYEVCSCIGKEQHTSEVAKQIARRQRKKGGTWARQSAYQCHSCGHWHVGPDSTRSTRAKHKWQRPGGVK